jgi:uncharacterized membrane protein (UPF0127 family)
MKRALPLLAALLAGLLTACQPESTGADRPLGADAWLPLKIGEVELRAQIAISDAEQRKGLMYRDALPQDSGMLFPYTRPRQLSFWMANTRIPLDIGFFDATGLLVEVHRLVPFDTTPVQSRGRDLQFALEMDSGWFARNGLYPGQRLDMQVLAESLRRRGADPRAYGIGR